MGRRAMKILRELLADESGATVAEYSLLLLLVTAGVVGTVAALRLQIMSVLDRATESLRSLY